jgi:hypothetical protein
MKPVLTLLTIICLVVPAAGQTATDPTATDPTATDPTVAALTALLPLKDQAKFGAFLRANHERTKFAGFLDAQGRFALLANKQTLLHVKTEADRPNYGGNAAARTRNNLWLSVLEGKAAPSPTQPAKTGN